MYEEIYAEINKLVAEIVKEIVHNMDISEQTFKELVDTKNIKNFEIYNKAFVSAFDKGDFISHRKYIDERVKRMSEKDVEWEEIRYDHSEGYYILYRCPICGCERPKRDNYCKDCGTKMANNDE